MSHNDVMAFARKSYYRSRVLLMSCALLTGHVLSVMIGLQHIAQ